MEVKPGDDPLHSRPPDHQAADAQHHEQQSAPSVRHETFLPQKQIIVQLVRPLQRAAVEDVFSEHRSAILIKEDVLAASIGPDGSEHPGRRWSAPGVKPVDAISRREGVGLAIQFLHGYGCGQGLNYREL